jgi:hypothetical protein
MVYTTNRRVWEHDEVFKVRLRAMRCMAIDRETATVFSGAWQSHPERRVAARARLTNGARRREDRRVERGIRLTS